MSTPEIVTLDVPVPSAPRQYPVVVGAGLLSTLGARARRLVPGAGRVALISDDNVAALYGGVARGGLEQAGFDVFIHEVRPGEASKSGTELFAALEAMVGAQVGRHDLVVALGGGVVGDLAGLAAALFMRGIPFVQCPTTLLAQVDASIGGKVAVDLPQGKNLVGAFHFPSAVLIDPDVLRTLPDVELGCGLAEMLKHGLLFSPAHVEALLEGADAVHARRGDVLTPLIADSVHLKAACVASDPEERSSDGRVLLNLGHTLGHAIEAAAGFELRHGEAVALGLRAAARISDRTGTSGGTLEVLVTDALRRLRLPTELAPWLEGRRGESVARALAHDKKRAASTISYIALADVGQPVVLSMTPGDILRLLRRAAERC
jgi:3-dehydroquinate synthase